MTPNRSLLPASAVVLALAAGARAAPLGPPVALTAAQNQQRMTDLLHINALRPPVAPANANFDEATVAPYTLPDPLTTDEGKKLATPEDWWTTRRAELQAKFDHQIYGVLPDTPDVTWGVVKTATATQGGMPVMVKTLTGRVNNATYPLVNVGIALTLVLPQKAKKPVPVVMVLDAAVPSGAAWEKEVLAQGWGYAIYDPTSVQPDDGAALTRGIVGLVNKGQPRAPDNWGVLRAWAWGASRTMDYFESDGSIESARVAIAGHGRFGAAALVAMAYDPRFAVGFIDSAGKSGGALMRRGFGEGIENLAAVDRYQRMAGNFLKYAGPLTANDLPADAHELIALAAPRPIFIGTGTVADDGWNDPKGTFLAEVAASPVYRFIGKKGLGADTFPPPGRTVDTGDLAFREAGDGKTAAANWPAFIAYAKRFLDKK